MIGYADQLGPMNEFLNLEVKIKKAPDLSNKFNRQKQYRYLPINQAT